MVLASLCDVKGLLALILLLASTACPPVHNIAEDDMMSVRSVEEKVSIPVSSPSCAQA